MAGFLKKLFGGGNDAEDMLQGMMERSEKWQVIGAENSSRLLSKRPDARRNSSSF